MSVFFIIVLIFAVIIYCVNDCYRHYLNNKLTKIKIENELKYSKILSENLEEVKQELKGDIINVRFSDGPESNFIIG